MNNIHYGGNTMYTTYDVLNDFFCGFPVTEYPSDYPRINLYEKDNTFEIHALLPGFKADDVSVELMDGSLVVEAERDRDVERQYVRDERGFGKFKRTFRLPHSIDRESITASMTNGVLVVTLTKSEEAKPKKIEIH